MRLIITGTGRCGTAYINRVLTLAGISSGHESAYNPTSQQPLPDRDVDVSWLAAPHTRGHMTLVVHRHPRHVIASLLGIQFFHRPNHYTEYAYQHLPELQHMPPLRAANYFYQRWNMLCLVHADHVASIDNPPWDWIAHTLGTDPAPLHAAAATVLTTTNHRATSALHPGDIQPSTLHVHTLLNRLSS